MPKMLIVDPPSGWKYGFPVPAHADYEEQLRDHGYPEDSMTEALNHSRYYTHDVDRKDFEAYKAECSFDFFKKKS